MELRCHADGCDYWLGESTQPLVFVETVSHSRKATVAPPRDIRQCKGCGEKNIYIPRSELPNRRRLTEEPA